MNLRTRILNNQCVKSGDPFTASVLASATASNLTDVRNHLRELLQDGTIRRVEQGGTTNSVMYTLVRSTPLREAWWPEGRTPPQELPPGPLEWNLEALLARVEAA